VEYRDWIGSKPEEFLPKVMVWTVQDFETLAMDIVDLHKCVDLLSNLRGDRMEKYSDSDRATYLNAIEQRLEARGF
jgi:hypothetical protein